MGFIFETGDIPVTLQFTYVDNTKCVADFPDIKQIYEPCPEKTCFMPCVNNKDADQLAYSCSLISTFVVRCLDSIIPLAIAKFLRP